MADTLYIVSVAANQRIGSLHTLIPCFSSIMYIINILFHQESQIDLIYFTIISIVILLGTRVSITSCTFFIYYSIVFYSYVVIF